MRQLRFVTMLLTIVAVLAVYQAATAPAAQAVGLLGSLSFPLWSERTTTAHAGVNQLVTFGTPGDESVKAFYKNGFLVLPKDKYGVFADLAVMRVDPLILGIEPEHIKDVKTEGGCGVSDGGAVIIKVGELDPDLYDVITRVVQNQGRVDESGLVPTLLQIVGRKKHHQVVATDVVASTFGVVDASRYIEMFCKYQLGLNDPTKMTDEQKYVVKSVYFDSRLKGTLEFTEAVADYSWLSQGLALRLQGFKPPMAQDQMRDDPAVAAYKQEIDQLKKLVELLQTKQTDPAPALVTWSIRMPKCATWTVWVDGANVPVYITADTVVINSDSGTHWVEITQAGLPFVKWDKYEVAANGQFFQEVK